MNTPSGEVPNSVSNHTLQAMLAARSPARWGDLAPTFEELNDPSFQKLMVEMSAFKRLVESGAISGSEADAWKKASAEEAEVAAFRVRAEGGDAVAMMRLGFAYQDGTNGLKKDATQSFMWLKRAADLKEVRGLAECGVAYLNGEGVEQSDSRGLSMLSVAAAMGSEHACGLLGQANAEGCYGLDKNPQEATRWYREMQMCDRRDSCEQYREDAAAWLREHPYSQRQY